MANVFDYLRWRGDLSFAESPLNEIDALIFCELSYIFFDGIVPADKEAGSVTLAEAAETFFERNANKDIIKLGEIVPDEIVDLFRLAATTRRFSDVALEYFINIVDDEAVEQFSAVTFIPGDESIFVAFRGTDDTITGWREDFRMAFLTPVPAQRRAEEYLSVAAEGAERIYIGGHSKGGNLALWSALNASDELCDRIEKVYNFDGPGFLDDVWVSSGYERISGKVSTVVPTGSVVGLLLKYDANYRVTKSTAKNYLYQHDALTWEVLGIEFVCDDSVAPEVKKAHDMVGRWVYSMEPAEREAFVEGFFDILCSTNAKTVTDLAENRSAVIKAFSNIDPETKQALMSGIKFFMGEGRSSVTEAIRSIIRKKSDTNEEPDTVRESNDEEKQREPIKKTAAPKKQTKQVKSGTPTKQIKRTVPKKHRKLSAVERMARKKLMQSKAYVRNVHKKK